jgi:hypothetical protein
VNSIKFILATFLALSVTMISCSDVKFSNTPSSECTDGCVLNPDGSETYNRVLTVQAPNNKVDILFVVDNSGTMIQEQQHIAYRFPGFIQSINNLNWRIAIATTDNLPAGVYSDFNGGEYRDGKLVPFRLSSNSVQANTYFIEKNMPNAQSLFQRTIQRPESLQCVNQPWNCPQIVSGDERGILTAIKQILNPNPTAFMRADAQLHIIFIADEDERSNGGGFPGMPIEANDKPETLVNYLKATGKRFQVHSIINVPPHIANGYINYIETGFQSCVQSQINNTSGQEYLGCHYALATALTGGVVGSIASTNYTDILAQISYSIHDTSLSQIQFNCMPRQVVITPVEGGYYPATLSNPYVVNNPGARFITFNPPLPPGTQLNVQWTCPRGSI